MTPDWLASRAVSSPAHPALVWRERTWTYAELNAAVQELAARLYAAGLREGQRAAVLLPNQAPFVMLIHALLRLGVVLIPLNLRLTADELRWQVTRSACAWILHDQTTAALAASTNPTSAVALALEALPPAENFPPHPFDLEAPLAIIHTSGTTGHPKGAIQTVGNHFYSAVASAFRLGSLPTDRWLLTIPLYHVGGLAIPLRCCLYGTTVVLPSQEKFDAASLLEDIESHAVTMVSLVPTMLQKMMEIQPPSPAFGHLSGRGLRLILLGGASASPALLETARQHNLPIVQTYGLTEAASQVATASPELARAKPGCAGAPLMFTSIRIDGAQEPGQVGEILVSGPTIMRGYDANPDATAAALRDGWLHTGDLGYLDTDGDLWVLSRRSDLIVSGGENIYPAEVERALLEHPAIREACVVGLDDPTWGQRVAAAVTLQPGASVSLEEIQAHCRARLAGYKCPRSVQILPQLPLTGSGKIQRAEVQRILQGAAA